MTPVLVKLCGLNDIAAVQCAAKLNVAFAGFIFYPASPRHVTIEKMAALMHETGRCAPVAVSVNADDALLDAITQQAKPKALQLHGAESPQRVGEIRARYALPIIKAIAIREAADVTSAAHYETVADYLLFDAKPPKNAPLPGGNGLAFDWQLLRGLRCSVPWFVSGGLDEDNVNEALSISQAPAVDVSSGIERIAGVKDCAKMQRFVQKIQKDAV